MDDPLEQSVKRRFSNQDKRFGLLGVSPVAREMALIKAAGSLNISSCVAASLTEINKVRIKPVLRPRIIII